MCDISLQSCPRHRPITYPPDACLARLPGALTEARWRKSGLRQRAQAQERYIAMSTPPLRERLPLFDYPPAPHTTASPFPDDSSLLLCTTLPLGADAEASVASVTPL